MPSIKSALKYLYSVRSVSRISRLASQSLRTNWAELFSFCLDEYTQVTLVVWSHILLAAPVCQKKAWHSFSHLSGALGTSQGVGGVPMQKKSN